MPPVTAPAVPKLYSGSGVGGAGGFGAYRVVPRVGNKTSRLVPLPSCAALAPNSLVIPPSTSGRHRCDLLLCALVVQLDEAQTSGTSAKVM